MAPQLKYEPEADVLSWEIIQDAPIDSAREIGNIVVHFTSNNEPVLIEILEASSFLEQAQKVRSQKSGQSQTANAIFI